MVTFSEINFRKQHKISENFGNFQKLIPPKISRHTVTISHAINYIANYVHATIASYSDCKQVIHMQLMLRRDRHLSAFHSQAVIQLSQSIHYLYKQICKPVGSLGTE